MSKTNISGEGQNTKSPKQTISKRAVAGKITVKKRFCKNCGNNKAFIGNTFGQGINKCCKCKRAF